MIAYDPETNSQLAQAAARGSGGEEYVSLLEKHMNCREFVEFICAYREGELRGEVLREFEKHVAGCKPCVDYLRDYGNVIALAKGAYSDPESEVPDEAPQELIDAVMAAIRRRKN